MHSELIIGIVGPCKSGKSELRSGLYENGFKSKHIAQEHSFVPKMWKKLVDPDVLVYLDVSYKNTITRGKIKWTEKDFLKQIKRLENARDNADIFIDTNDKGIDEVLGDVLGYISQ